VNQIGGGTLAANENFRIRKAAVCPATGPTLLYVNYMSQCNSV